MKKSLLAFGIFFISLNSFAIEYKAFSCKTIFAGYDIFLDSEDREYIKVEKTAPDLGPVFEAKVLERGPVFTIYFVDDFGPQLLIKASNGGNQIRKVTEEDNQTGIIKSELVTDKMTCEDNY